MADSCRRLFTAFSPPSRLYFASNDILSQRGAGTNKVRGEIHPCAVENRSSTRAIGLIACMNMRALMDVVGGLCPQYNKSGGGGGIAPPAHQAPTPLSHIYSHSKRTIPRASLHSSKVAVYGRVYGFIPR